MTEKNISYETTTTTFDGVHIIFIDVVQVAKNGNTGMKFREQAQLFFRKLARQYSLLLAQIQIGQHLWIYFFAHRMGVYDFTVSNGEYDVYLGYFSEVMFVKMDDCKDLSNRSSGLS